MHLKIVLSILTILCSIITYAQEDLPLAKSDSLFAKGVELYNQERYEEAIPLFIESDRIDKAVLDSTSNRRDYSAMWLASCHFHLGDTVTAQNIDPNFYCFTPIDRRLTVKSDSLSHLGIKCYQQEDYSKAIEYFSSCAEIEFNILGDKHMWYGNTVSYLGQTKLQTGQDDGIKDIETYCNIVLTNYGEDSEKYILALQELCGGYAYIGNYNEAIKVGTEILNIQERTIGKKHHNYVISLNNLAKYNSDSGNYEEAIRYGIEALNILEQTIGKQHRNYAAILNNLANYNYFLRNYNEAIILGTEALNIKEITIGKDNYDYITSLNNLAIYNSDLGNYKEAIRLRTESLMIQEKTVGKENYDYIISLSHLAIYNSNLANYNESIRLVTEALYITESTLGKENTNYVTLLNVLANYNSQAHNYSEAIRVETEALDIIERNIGKEHSDYLIALSNLATDNSNIGNYIKAIRLGKEVLNIQEQTISKEHSDYAATLSFLATNNFYLGNYIEAIKLITEALEIQERTIGKEHSDYIISLNKLSSFNSNLGNYAEAIRVANIALNIQEKNLGKEHSIYANILGNLSIYNYNLGKYHEAIRLATEALNIQERAKGKDDPVYATLLHYIGLYNFALGDYNQAINSNFKALNVHELTLGRKHPIFGNSLGSLASYIADIGNYPEAIRLTTEALNTIEQTIGKEHSIYGRYLNNLSLYNSYLGNYNAAIKLGTEALNIIERTIGKEHPDYAISLSNLAFYTSKLGNFMEAIRLSTEALNIEERTIGKEHPNYIEHVSNLAYYNFLDCNSDRLESYTTETNKLRTELVRKTMINLTGSERRNFWNIHKYWYENLVNQFSSRYPTPVLVGNAFDATLMGKGILLNSEIDFSRLIQESNDAEAISMFNELRTTRRMLDRLYEKPIAERYMNTDSLENVAMGLERTLLAKSKVYGDFTHNMTIGWKDVQKKLKSKDVAIEFVSFPTETDSVVYAAYILKIEMDSPRMVTLFEEKQLNGLSRSDLYTSKYASSLIWGKLNEYTANADNIYFAPTGELYNIAIESLPEPDREGLICDHHNMYRLSSTRELAVIRDKNTPREAALYGGMKYDSDVKTMADDSERYPDLQRDFSLFNLADSLNLRAGASNLPATQTEVENIDRSLKQTMIKSHLYTGTDGTEGSFKALSGKKTGIMHIATHGFYWTQSEARRMNRLNFLQSWDNSLSRYEEDKALTRSGLLFTGANNALTGKPLPENAQDGILTAKEISELDLRGLDMVVLSACQTGLGEITGDGVFGLQRGFKKAGANTLLMSLWKVDDTATQMLMNKFYEHFLSGKSKRESLVLAQKYLREYEAEESEDDDSGLTASQQRRKEHSNEILDETTPRKIKVKPYTHPRYWAAFILLDALD